MSTRKMLLLGLVISSLFALVSCAAPPAPQPAPAPTQAPAAEPTVAPEPTNAPAAADKMIVAILTSGPASDGGWSYHMIDGGRKALEAAYGDRIEVVTAESVPWGDATAQTMEQFIAQGAKVIIDGSAGGDFTTKVATAHPDVKFFRIETSKLPNEESIWFDDTQYAYLFGMVAGLLTKTDKIGFVNPFDFPLLRGEINAYQLGARSVNPKATTSVVTINAWNDPAAERQAVDALADSGVDVVMPELNGPGVVSAAEERGIWAFGCYGDFRSSGPNAFVNAVIADFGKMFVDVVGKVLDGKWEGNGKLNFYRFDKGIHIIDWGAKVPQGVQDQGDALYKKMVEEGFAPMTGPISDKAGNVVIPAGQTMTGEEIMAGVPWLVEGIKGLE